MIKRTSYTSFLKSVPYLRGQKIYLDEFRHIFHHSIVHHISYSHISPNIHKHYKTSSKGIVLFSLPPLDIHPRQIPLRPGDLSMFCALQGVCARSVWFCVVFGELQLLPLTNAGTQRIRRIQRYKRHRYRDRGVLSGLGISI